MANISVKVLKDKNQTAFVPFTITDAVFVPDTDKTVTDLVDETIATLEEAMETIPTKTSDLTNDSGFIDNTVDNLVNYTLSTDVGTIIDMSIDTTTYVLTLSLKNAGGTVLSTDTVDLPIESMVVNATYDTVNKKIILTLQSGSTIEVPIGDIISGLQTEITASNKLSSDLVDDTNGTNKFVTTNEKSTWSAKYDKPNTGIPSTDLDNTVQTSLGKADTALQTETDPVFVASPAAGITANDIGNWNNKSDFSGSYNDLTNKPTSVSGYGITDAYTKTETDGLLNDKVDKVTGKGLSTEDYTTAEQTKLAGIETNAEVNTIESISVNSTTVSPVNKNVNITVPTTLAALTGDATHRTVSDTDIDNWDAKQDELVSGVNIRTVNGNNILGSGDIAISTTLPDSLINWGTSVGTSPIFNDLVQRYIYVVKFTYSTNTTAYLRYRKPDESITSITMHSVAPEIMDANGPILLITTSDTTCELHYVSDNKYYVCTVTYNSSTGLLTANNEVFHIPHLAYIASAMGAPNAPVAITSDMINRIKGKNKAYYINIGQNKNGNKALRLYLSINGGSTINITNTNYKVVGDIKIYAVDLDDYGIAVGVIVHVPTHLGMYVFKIDTSDNSVTDLIKPNGDISQYTGYSASATQVLSHDSSGNKTWVANGGSSTSEEIHYGGTEDSSNITITPAVLTNNFFIDTDGLKYPIYTQTLVCPKSRFTTSRYTSDEARKYTYLYIKETYANMPTLPTNLKNIFMDFNYSAAYNDSKSFTCAAISRINATHYSDTSYDQATDASWKSDALDVNVNINQDTNANKSPNVYITACKNVYENMTYVRVVINYTKVGEGVTP